MQFDSSAERPSFAFALKDLAPGLPSDWEEYNYLVLEMKASSPQRFYVGPVTAGGFLPKGVQPFPGARIRFCIPLDYFRKPPVSAVDMAATYNKKRLLGMVNIHSEATGALRGIDSLRFYMNRPLNNPTLEIFAVSLAAVDPGDMLLQEGFLVDDFGQWAVGDWPGKAQDIADLIEAWKHEEAGLAPLFPDASPYGGYPVKVGEAGFFRTIRIEGRWWFLDPDGHLFLSVGADCMNASSSTSVDGREYIFRGLPQGKRADYYRRNIESRYGGEAEAEEGWVNTALRRMRAWGLNTIGNWSSADIIRSAKMPFVLSLPGLKLGEGVMGLPDIYDPQYAADIDKAIGGMAKPLAKNRWLIGYFVGNEQPWPGQESLLCDRILEGPDRPFKTALNEWLRQKGDSPEARKAFVYYTFDRFLGLVNATLRRHDPNHLNIGMRFGGETPDELLALTGKHFDVFSYNCYATVPDTAFMNRVARITGLPILIGEYHFGVPDRGMAAGIVQVASQQERGEAYRLYNEEGYAHPSLIGAHWFQWIDQPNTGRMDGENYNIGLLDITDRPYPEMVEAMKATHSRLFEIHSATKP
jgi:hypothetical protein